MDNQKTGALIRQLRTDRGMTQKDLARQLAVTDRAVSKWERGLCAPDIALLEPLAAVLGCPVESLLRGEMVPPEAAVPDTVRILDWARAELTRQAGRLHRRMLLGIGAALAGLALLAGWLLWQSGTPWLLETISSPDGTCTARVYSKELAGRGFGWKDGVSLIVSQADGSEWRVIYGSCEFGGLWWAPDGSRYVLALETAEGTRLCLARLEQNAESNLNAYLTMGVQASELAKYDYTPGPDGWPAIRYEFLQWARDSRSMLLYYSFTAADGQTHEGYFWYDCESGAVRAVMEMQQDGLH